MQKELETKKEMNRENFKDNKQAIERFLQRTINKLALHKYKTTTMRN